MSSPRSASACRWTGSARRALPNNEGRLRSESEMRRIFAGNEAAVVRALGEVAARAAFSLDELQYQYPSEVAVRRAGLARAGRAGLHWRYPTEARPTGCARRWPVNSL